jgi:protein TonB
VSVMTARLPFRDPAGRRRALVVVVVVLVHLALFTGLSPPRSVPPSDPVRSIDVVLIQPEPPPPPPPPPAPARSAGGGAPSAPSRVHTPPDPVARPVELIAPPVPAPEPALTVGLAPVVTPEPGTGRGEAGTGTGTGTGAGSGPGSGGTPPRFMRGPTRAEIVRTYPRAALAARQTGHVLLRCRIGLDTRLDGCRVVDETPPGAGFGAAALQAATAFRFRPPVVAGQARDDFIITVGVEFSP